MKPRRDEEVLRDAHRTMRHCEAVALSSLAAHLGVTAKRLRRLIESCDQFTLRGSDDLLRAHSRYSTEPLWLDGLANPRTLNNRHVVRPYCTYVQKAHAWRSDYFKPRGLGARRAPVSPT